MPKSESGENVPPGDGGQKKPSNYEMQRLKRMEENKKRMEALGLHKMADSFMGSVQKTQKNNDERKGKKKIVDEDDEYNPTEEDNEVLSSSSEEDDNDDEFSISHKKVKKKSPNPKKRASIQKPILGSDFMGDDDDDDALKQAIALSLQDYVPSKAPAKDTVDVPIGKRKDNSYIQNDSGKKKRKTPEKPKSGRVQMTEDEMIAHFFQFDEIGKGGINLRDIQRLATAHDFTWSEKEISDMVSCFDGDGDGKINLDDFRKIVCGCNMLKGYVGKTG